MYNLDQLLLKMYTVLTKVDLEMFFSIIRNLWIRINNCVFNNTFPSPQKLLCTVKGEFEEY